LGRFHNHHHPLPPPPRDAARALASTDANSLSLPKQQQPLQLFVSRLIPTVKSADRVALLLDICNYMRVVKYSILEASVSTSPHDNMVGAVQDL
jgi:hypothetical protein